MPKQTKFKDEKDAISRIKAARKEFIKARAAGKDPDGGQDSPDGTNGSTVGGMNTSGAKAGGYAGIVQLLGQTNYPAMQELFAGSGAPPNGTDTDVVISFELFEAVQQRAAATKQELDTTKLEAVKSNQRAMSVQQENNLLVDRVSNLEKQVKEAQEYIQHLRQLSSDAATSRDKREQEVEDQRLATKEAQKQLEKVKEELAAQSLKASDGLVALVQRDALITSLKREKAELQERLEKGGGGSVSGVPTELTKQSSSGALKRLRSVVREVTSSTQASQLKIEVSELKAERDELSSKMVDMHAFMTSTKRHTMRMMEMAEREQMFMHDAISGHRCAFSSRNAARQQQSGQEDEIMDGDEEENEDPTALTPTALLDKMTDAIDDWRNFEIDASTRYFSELDTCRDASVAIARVGSESLRLLERFNKYLDDSVSLTEVKDRWAGIEKKWFKNISIFCDTGFHNMRESYIKLTERERRIVAALNQDLEAEWDHRIKRDYVKRTDHADAECQTFIETGDAGEQIGAAFYKDYDTQTSMTEIVRGLLHDKDASTWTDVDFKVPDWVVRLPVPPAELQEEPRRLFDAIPERMIVFHKQLMDLAQILRKKMKLKFTIADPTQFLKSLNVNPTVIDAYEVIGFDERVVKALLASLVLDKEETEQRLKAHKNKSAMYKVQRTIDIHSEDSSKKMNIVQRQEMRDLERNRARWEADAADRGDDSALQEAIEMELASPADNEDAMNASRSPMDRSLGGSGAAMAESFNAGDARSNRKGSSTTPFSEPLRRATVDSVTSPMIGFLGADNAKATGAGAGGNRSRSPSVSNNRSPLGGRSPMSPYIPMSNINRAHDNDANFASVKAFAASDMPPPTAPHDSRRLSAANVIANKQQRRRGSSVASSQGSHGGSSMHHSPLLDGDDRGHASGADDANDSLADDDDDEAQHDDDSNQQENSPSSYAMAKGSGSGRKKKPSPPRKATRRHTTSDDSSHRKSSQAGGIGVVKAAAKLKMKRKSVSVSSGGGSGSAAGGGTASKRKSTTSPLTQEEMRKHMEDAKESRAAKTAAVKEKQRKQKEQEEAHDIERAEATRRAAKVASEKGSSRVQESKAGAVTKVKRVSISPSANAGDGVDTMGLDGSSDLVHVSSSGTYVKKVAGKPTGPQTELEVIDEQYGKELRNTESTHDKLPRAQRQSWQSATEEVAKTRRHRASSMGAGSKPSSIPTSPMTQSLDGSHLLSHRSSTTDNKQEHEEHLARLAAAKGSAPVAPIDTSGNNIADDGHHLRGNSATTSPLISPRGTTPKSTAIRGRKRATSLQSSNSPPMTALTPRQFSLDEVQRIRASSVAQVDVQQRATPTTPLSSAKQDGQNEPPSIDTTPPPSSRAPAPLTDVPPPVLIMTEPTSVHFSPSKASQDDDAPKSPSVSRDEHSGSAVPPDPFARTASAAVLLGQRVGSTGTEHDEDGSATQPTITAKIPDHAEVGGEDDGLVPQLSTADADSEVPPGSTPLTPNGSKTANASSSSASSSAHGATAAANINSKPGSNDAHDDDNKQQFTLVKTVAQEDVDAKMIPHADTTAAITGADTSRNSKIVLLEDGDHHDHHHHAGSHGDDGSNLGSRRTSRSHSEALVGSVKSSSLSLPGSVKTEPLSAMVLKEKFEKEQEEKRQRELEAKKAEEEAEARKHRVKVSNMDLGGIGQSNTNDNDHSSAGVVVALDGSTRRGSLSLSHINKLLEASENASKDSAGAAVGTASKQHQQQQRRAEKAGDSPRQNASLVIDPSTGHPVVSGQAAAAAAHHQRHQPAGGIFIVKSAGTSGGIGTSVSPVDDAHDPAIQDLEKSDKLPMLHGNNNTSRVEHQFQLSSATAQRNAADAQRLPEVLSIVASSSAAGGKTNATNLARSSSQSPIRSGKTSPRSPLNTSGNAKQRGVFSGIARMEDEGYGATSGRSSSGGGGGGGGVLNIAGSGMIKGSRPIAVPEVLATSSREEPMYTVGRNGVLIPNPRRPTSEQQSSRHHTLSGSASPTDPLVIVQQPFTIFGNKGGLPLLETVQRTIPPDHQARHHYFGERHAAEQAQRNQVKEMQVSSRRAGSPGSRASPTRSGGASLRHGPQQTTAVQSLLNSFGTQQQNQVYGPRPPQQPLPHHLREEQQRLSRGGKRLKPAMSSPDGAGVGEYHELSRQRGNGSGATSPRLALGAARGAQNTHVRSSPLTTSSGGGASTARGRPHTSDFGGVTGSSSNLRAPPRHTQSRDRGQRPTSKGVAAAASPFSTPRGRTTSDPSPSTTMKK